jgi:hypothetical protein
LSATTRGFGGVALSLFFLFVALPLSCSFSFLSFLLLLPYCALALSLVKYLAANSEEAVKRHSKSAIDLAMNVDACECLEEDGSLSAAGRAAMQEAIGELGKLKGVGPATASAILSLVRPDVFCFLYDEAIDTFEKTRQEPNSRYRGAELTLSAHSVSYTSYLVPQSSFCAELYAPKRPTRAAKTRDYKVSNYLRVNSRCMQLARDLGVGWTTARVAKAIWIASRFLAMHGRDLTAGEPGAGDDIGGDGAGSGDDGSRNEEDESESKRAKKPRTT